MTMWKGSLILVQDLPAVSAAPLGFMELYSEFQLIV